MDENRFLSTGFEFEYEKKILFLWWEQLLHKYCMFFCWFFFCNLGLISSLFCMVATLQIGYQHMPQCLSAGWRSPSFALQITYQICKWFSFLWSSRRGNWNYSTQPPKNNIVKEPVLTFVISFNPFVRSSQSSKFWFNGVQQNRFFQ